MVGKRRLPLVSSRVRYGLVAVIAVTICVFTVADAVTVGLEGSGESSYGPFGIDVGPLGWFETLTYTHGMAYAGFTASLAYAFVAPTDHGGRLVRCVAVAVVYGTVLELLQGSVDSRNVEIVDFLANATGASLMAICWWRLDGAVDFVPRSDATDSDSTPPDDG